MTYTDVAGAAVRLRLSYNQVLRLVLRGELRGLRINGRWRVELEDLERIARSRDPRVASAPAAPQVGP